MKKSIYILTGVMIIMVVNSACVTRKKKGDISKTGKFYQNTTAYYNGYWNAKELMRESLISLRAANNDNFSEILEVEDYVNLDNPKMAKPDMDKIIEKVSTVAQLREASDWVDDCYVMMARAQYTKQEYETAEETLEYFEEDFNPGNPYGRNYKSKKLRGKAAKRMKEIAKKEKEKDRKEKAKEKEKIVEEKAEKAKDKNEERKKAAKAKAKERERAAKERKKNKGKSDRKIVTPAKTTISTPTTTPTPTKTEANNKKEEEIETPPVKIAPVEDKTAFSEGRLWLAKTYIKRENYSGAESILNRLSEVLTNEDVTRELPAVQASLYIKKKEYDKALIALTKAVELADERQNKARYSFIAGQIYQRLGQYGEAYTYFDKATRLSKDVKMEFVADLASLKTGILSGQASKVKTIEQLTRRISEEKYVEYKDQLYYTIGEIEKSQENYDAAIDSYKKCISNANSNSVKVDAYYNIAEIYFNQEKYLQSWKHYDSTSAIILKTDFRYGKVQNYALNLKEIASQIEIINQQDTLLLIAALEGNDQKKAAKKYFVQSQKNQVKNTNTQPKSSTFFSSIQKTDNSNSSFFAYNEAVKKKGREDFIKLWGDRPLSDDWRRRAAASNSLAVAEDGKASNPDKQIQGKTPEELEDERIESSDDYKKFLRELPTNPIKRQEINDKIMNAQFVLGKLFRDKIQKYDKSALTLENMHTKFGETPFELESSYYLYLDYLELNDNVNSAKYKAKIIDKYGDSKYASILRNPEAYAKANNVDKPDQYYNQVYKLFNEGKYQDAIINIDKATTSLDSSNPYKAKFALLRAMCQGSTQGKDAYVQGLMALVTTFPNTPEELKAKEILRFLGGDKSAFSGIGVQDVDKIYEKSDEEKHYVAVVTYQLKEEDLVAAKIAISDYNKANFKLDRLQMGDGILNIEDNSQIILVRSFDNSTKAMEFYKKVFNDKEAFLGSKTINADILPISTRNYRKMLSERNANGYRVFFEKNYKMP